MANIFLLRHGQSMSNIDIPVEHEQQNILSVNGLHDLRHNTYNFKDNNPDLKFQYVFTSPFLRAIQTTCNFLTITENPAVDLRIVEDFKERDYGFEKFVIMPDLIDRFGIGELNTWDSDLNKRPTPTGESINEVHTRVVKAWEANITPLMEEDVNILVVSHHYIMRSMAYNYYNELGLLTKFHPENGVVYRMKDIKNYI